MPKPIATYKNGNYTVQIFEDGTKIRECKKGTKFQAAFPESIDIKITNWCDMSHICGFCHEASNKQGHHANLDILFNILKPLPSGVELALGGGSTLSHPEIREFLQKCKAKGWIPNITVNELHLHEQQKTIQKLIREKLIHGVGISLRSRPNHDELIDFANQHQNTVIHTIDGINTVEELNQITNRIKNPKILILGYKHRRKGKTFFKKFKSTVEKNIQTWYNQLPVFIDTITHKNGVVAFDNLALEHLNLQRILSPKEWKTFFQGTDGSHTFYIDATTQKFAQSSTMETQFPFEGDVITMFKQIKK